MAEKLVLISVRVIEVMFFTGLVGCLFNVIFSWISILRSIIFELD